MTREPVTPWWDDDRRVCKGDDRYTDPGNVLATKELGTKRAQIIDMINGCLVCPVYYECLADLLRTPKGEHYGIRAGIRGKS